MKHWDKEDKKTAQYMRDDDVEHGIILSAGSMTDCKILSVAKKKDGGFNFMEECNNCFSLDYTKKEALELIEELKNWIEDN